MFNFLKDTQGATSIEYGLIAALMTVGTIGAVSSAGSEAGTSFGSVAFAMSAEGRLSDPAASKEELTAAATEIVAASTRQEVEELHIELWNNRETRNAAALLAAAQNEEDPSRFTLWRELASHWNQTIGFDENGKSWQETLQPVERDLERIIEIATMDEVIGHAATQLYAYHAHRQLGTADSPEAQASLEIYRDYYQNRVDNGIGAPGHAEWNMVTYHNLTGDTQTADAYRNAAVQAGYPAAVQSSLWKEFSSYRSAGQESSAAAQTALTQAIEAGSGSAMNYADWRDYSALKASGNETTAEAQTLLSSLASRGHLTAIKEQRQLGQES